LNSKTSPAAIVGKRDLGKAFMRAFLFLKGYLYSEIFKKRKPPELFAPVVYKIH
jgi:hypothetical protein